MGGRGKLAGGFRPWLPDHRRPEGVVFRRYLRAALEVVGPVNGSELRRSEVQRYAVSGLAYEQAARTWAEAVARRDRGRGRRPSGREVERAARRLGLAEQTLAAATARLEALAARNSHGSDLAARFAALHEARRG